MILIRIKYVDQIPVLIVISVSFKDEVTAAVQELLKLKEQYKSLTGTDVPSTGAAPARKEKEKKPAAATAANSADNEQAAGSGSSDMKKQTKYVLITT